MTTCTVDRQALARLLRGLKNANRNVQAEGTWTLRPSELQVDWGNGGGTLEARSPEGEAADSEQTCHVSAALMARLPLVLSGRGEVVVSMTEGRLFLDRLGVTAFLEKNPQDPLLPKSPRAVDYLLLPKRHDRVVIDAAGLRPHVSKAEVRYAETLTAVNKKLEWLGITQAEIKRFVEDRLKDRAAGQERLL